MSTRPGSEVSTVHRAPGANSVSRTMPAPPERSTLRICARAAPIEHAPEFEQLF